VQLTMEGHASVTFDRNQYLAISLRYQQLVLCIGLRILLHGHYVGARHFGIRWL